MKYIERNKKKSHFLRTGQFSVKLVNREMLQLMDYFGAHKAKDGAKTDMKYDVSRGEALDIPVLDASSWVLLMLT